MRKRRWLRRLLWIVGSLLLLIVVLVGGVWIALQSDWGGGFAQRKLVAQVNDRISGKLEVGKLDFRGATLVLEDVTLRDPSGERVAHFAKLVIDLGPTALFRRTLWLQRIELIEPELYVRKDADGTNLQAALAPREPKPEKPEQPPEKEGGPPPISVVIDQLTVRDGFIQYEDVTGESPLAVVADGLGLHGKVSLLRKGNRLDAQLGADGTLLSPVVGPIALQLGANGAGDDKSADAKASVAGAKLNAHVELSPQQQRMHVKVEELLVPPELARGFAEQWPLQVPLTAQGQLDKQGGLLNFGAQVHAGDGTLTAEGDFDLDTFTTTGTKVNAEHLNLAQLSPKAPPSDIAAELFVDGGGTSFESAEGTLRFLVPEAKLDGTTLGPIRLRANAHAGTIALEELNAKLPGLSLTASGHGSQSDVKIVGRLAASDLAKFGDTLGRLAKPDGLAVSGRGALAFRLEGPPRGLQISADGDFPHLTYEANRIEGLKLELLVPNLAAPLSNDANISVQAQRVLAGGKSWRRPHLSLRLEDQTLRLGAGTRGFATLDLSAHGKVDDDRRGLSLSALTLRYPEATWRLQRPTHLRLGTERQSIDHLTLRSGRQTIALDGWLEGERLSASARLHEVDLGRLPKAFVDPSLHLDGRANLDLRAHGTTKRPRGRAEVALKDVRFKDYRHLDGELRASWDGRRAEGRLRADALGVKAHGTFDLPVLELRTGGTSPARAELVVEPFEVPALLAKLGKKAEVEGMASARISLSGTAGDPRVDATVRMDDASYADLPAADLLAQLASDKDGTLGAELSATVEGRPSTVSLKTPWTLGTLLQHPPKKEQLLRAPLRLAMKLDDLPVPIPAQRPRGEPVAQGTFAVPPSSGTGGSGDEGLAAAGFARLRGELELHGTALRPLGGGEIHLNELCVGDLSHVAAALKLDLRANENAVQLELNQADRNLLRANAALHAPIARLYRPEGYVRAPFEIDAVWGPLSILQLQQWMPAPRRPDEEPPPLLTGLTSGELKVNGSLADPEVTLSAAAHGLGVASASAKGDASVRYRYQDGQSRLEADLLSGADGVMALRAEAPLELSWRALQSGLNWRRAEVTGTLTAHGFDPSFLSGVTPMIQEVGGNLEAKIDAHGPLSLPRIAGRFEWKNGTLALEGKGRYERIHLLAEGNQDRLELKDLTAHAGSGQATVTGAVSREGDGARFDAKAKLDEFPIVTEGQLTATVSLESTAEGTASVERVEIPSLKIDEAHVLLPPKGRKDVQSLDVPDDVVFVWNGEPLEPKEKESKKKGVGGAGNAGAPTRVVEVTIDAPRNLWVRGKDLNVEVGLGPGFRVLYRDEPQLFGEVRVMRGRLEVMGRGFDLQKESKITFTGPMLDPRLDVAAVYDNEREGVQVTLHVTGHGEDLQIKPTSDPPLSETEIYTLIATGRRSLEPGSGAVASNPAASVLGSVIAGQLKEQLQAVLPLDVLQIQAGSGGVSGTRVKAGVYVTDRLYLGIRSEIGARREQYENQNELNLEYQLWRRWMLDLVYGDARKGSADLLWRKRY